MLIYARRLCDYNVYAILRSFSLIMIIADAHLGLRRGIGIGIMFYGNKGTYLNTYLDIRVVAGHMITWDL